MAQLFNVSTLIMQCTRFRQNHSMNLSPQNQVNILTLANKKYKNEVSSDNSFVYIQNYKPEVKFSYLPRY
ncbi:unnamed protein product, partial [Schistosoma curassoni]